MKFDRLLINIVCIVGLFISWQITYAAQCTPEQIQKMMDAGFSKDEIMKLCASSTEGTVQRHNEGDLPVTQTNNALPSIEWGPLDEYFSISNIRLGKQKQNIEGKIFIFNAIQFDVKAKIDINWLNLNYTVHFYDRDDIDMGYGSIGFEPKYRLLASAFGMMWQQGMPGIGFINLDSFSKENQNLDNVKKIRIQ